MAQTLTYTGLILLLIHEVDATIKSEYKMIGVFNKLTEKQSMNLFIGLHIPLFTILFWGSSMAENNIRDVFSLCLGLFYILHVGLHLLFIKHNKNKMNSLFSWAIIFLLGLNGILTLIIR